ncbi:MAG: glucosamine-6-phosphate deaminase [Verrucomicrobiaceae bacterium]|nr:MAG: glucosamine-6-phosphate deaminase [Verrucomicrobiaceae bacterium]
MIVHHTADPQELGRRAAEIAIDLIQQAIATRGAAHLILATGTSQFATLEVLRKAQIDWQKVKIFHLDEYMGLPASHPASFRNYLKERFLELVGPVGAVTLIDGEADPVKECARLGREISASPIDVALVGIGENGHLAFNDPPADFETKEPYIVVELDEACRAQQMNEGWFESLEQVPRRAISMSIHQIMKSRHIICSVPDARKAQAVKNSVENAIDPKFPASILQRHPDCHLFLDKASASLLANP